MKIQTYLSFPFRLIYAIVAGTYDFLKPKAKSFLSDLKYDRELNKVYKRANDRIKEAQGLCVQKNSQVFVLPDPNQKGDFFCISSKERKLLIKNKRLDARFDHIFCMQNAIFIAVPNMKHIKRKISIPKEWLLQK